MIVQDMVQEQTNTEPELDTAAAVELVRRLPWGALVLLRRVLEDALLRTAPPAAPALLRTATDLPALPDLLADLTDTDGNYTYCTVYYHHDTTPSVLLIHLQILDAVW